MAIKPVSLHLELCSRREGGLCEHENGIKGEALGQLKSVQVLDAASMMMMMIVEVCVRFCLFFSRVS